jgi:SAM-dependent methyltransferase
MNAYSSLEASLHDPFWASDGPPLELPLLRTFLQQHPGRSLEIGSGSGRLLLPLLAEGFDVEGLELSEDMITLCRQRELGQDATLHQGNMDDWVAARSYQTIMIPAFSLQLSRDPVAALQNIAQMLGDKGSLYFSSFTPVAEIMGDLPENEWYPDHQTTLSDARLATIHTRHQIDRELQKLHRQHRYEIFSTSGECESSHESEQIIHWFTRQQWKSHLRDAGFVIEQQIPDFRPARKSLAQAQILSTIAKRNFA